MSFASLMLAFAPAIFRPKQEHHVLRAELEALRADHAEALAEIGSLRRQLEGRERLYGAQQQGQQLAPQDYQRLMAAQQAQYQGLAQAQNQLAAQQFHNAFAFMNCTPGRADLLRPAPRP